jgi:acyl-CoA synthetase (NDP forming)
MRVQTGPSREPVDNATLEETLLKVSKFLENNPDIKEISLKPIFAYKDGAVAVKSRIILEEDA